MKKFIFLVLIFSLVTGYVFYKGLFDVESQGVKGDTSYNLDHNFSLGGTVKKPESDTMSIAEMQTAYIKYTTDDITFDEMIEENMKKLDKVLVFPFNPLPGYMFSVGYDYNSKVQYYYQSDQEETRTVIIRVEYNKDGNKVTKFKDGMYYELVSIDVNDLSKLIAYEADGTEYILEVE